MGGLTQVFCAFSETLTDVDNALVDAYLPVPSYGTISALPATEPPPPHTLVSFTHINSYMDDVIAAVQGGAERQHRVFGSTVCALKWLSPSLPGESKDSVSVKKFLAREGDRECVKEFLRWIIDTEAGTVALPERKLQELQDLLYFNKPHTYQLIYG